MSQIAGYSQPTEDQITLVNENKILEEMVLRQIDRHTQDAKIDQRFVALARTQIQTAFMQLNRAVFQPQRITPTTPDLEKFVDDCEGIAWRLARMERI